MKFTTLLILLCVFSWAEASIKVSSIRTSQGQRILSVEKSNKNISGKEPKLIQSIPYILDEGPKSTLNSLFEVYLYNESALPPHISEFMKSSATAASSIPGAEVRVLVNQGPKENRINLTILGDGYAAGEKEMFFADALRTTKNLFTGSTFTSYLPLFNVYAVFVPSAVSGIGDGAPKNTAFKLYRDPKGSKRTIMPGDTSTAERALKLAPATDYPIILANDEFYGGLGGRFAISTNSLRSGMVVLRHELGHNFGEVGEEYDGGSVYAGANSSGKNISWSHWLDGGLKYYQAKRLAGDYVWQNLSNNPYKQTFNFPSEKGTIFLADISTVGWTTPDDVFTTVDGKRISLEGTYHVDRNFYSVGPMTGVGAGKHTLMFTENIKDKDNVLAFSNIYALPEDYDFTPNRVAAFATYNEGNRFVGYRPTHESCLMRNMLVPYFCSVDKENMWLKFLDRLTLIDDVSVTSIMTTQVAKRGEKQVSLLAPKLPVGIFWFHESSPGKEVELTQYRNMTHWKATPELAGKFKVKVVFKTLEIRKPSKNLSAEKLFTL